MKYKKYYDMIEEQSKIFDKTQNCEIGQTWKYHLYPVIKNACMLADKYGADKDVVELAALFHDYADLLDMNNRKNHHILGAELTEGILLTDGYEKELAAYYTALYGSDWEKVVNYLERISDAFSFAYMDGELSSDLKRGTHYTPERAEHLDKVAELCAQIRAIESKRGPGKVRVQGVAWRLLLRHARYCEGLAAVMREKCVGHNRLAMEMYEQFLLDFGKYDYETERYFDFGLAASANKIIVGTMPAIEQ